MKKIHLLVSLVVLLPLSIAARQGWYLDFTSGLNSEVQVKDIMNNFPHGISAKSETGTLQILNLGYSFHRGFSLGTGLEFSNLVDIGYKLLLKWSFSEDKDFQPFIYTCVHGGISDVVLTSLHIGYGFDYFLADRVYTSVDARIGPCLVSGDPYMDPVSGKKNYDYHVEGTLSLGIGFLFGRDATKN
jgi:hypothetical protein